MKTAPKNLFGFISCIFVLAFFVPPVSASYVLPYPSYMPGNPMYTLSRMADSIKSVWAFGTISSLKYNVRIVDKYLVEAKTLFEYEQYNLAMDALRRSTAPFLGMEAYLGRAKTENKDIGSLKRMLAEQAIKHIEILKALKRNIPASIDWKEGDEASLTLHMHEEIDAGVQARERYMSTL